DRERDGLEPDPDSLEPAQRPDLHEVIEAERQHRSARGRRTDRCEAAGLVGLLLAREQPVPAAGAEDEAREVAECGERDVHGTRACERPARPGEALPDEDAG